MTKVVMAADVGTAVNPRGLQARLMATAVDGISTVLQAGLRTSGRPDALLLLHRSCGLCRRESARPARPER